MAAEMSPLPRLYYFADPMCSWCYGFVPVMAQVHEAYGTRFDIRLVMGGLRPGKLAQTMTPALARVMRHHWREVAKMTGQAFNEAFFEREGFVYDTEPAAKAVIVMEQLAPAHAYEYYHDIQQGFYAENADLTSTDVLATFAQKHGVKATDFAANFASEVSHKQTWGQFTFNASLGIRGFPSLVVEQDEKFMIVTRGWQPFEQIRTALDEAHKAVGGASCDVDGKKC
jgi:putative protein-disulfide isomerase